MESHGQGGRRSPDETPDDRPTVVSGSRPQGLSGRRIGPYRLVREIGHGGQGFVYLAEAEQPRRQVALKVLTAHAEYSALAKLRFEREAEVTARLSHPGVCAIFERGEADGIPYIAMQYVEGETLARRLKQSRERRETSVGEATTSCFVDIEGDTAEKKAATSSTLPGRPDAAVESILRFIDQTARTLHFAHEAGLVHRDIKPGNIMRSRDGRPVILDFGLAHDAQAGGLTLTQSGDFMGTPAYMAPEQFAGRRREVDRRADVYSLGVTLFECLTLERPFHADSREALFRQISFEEAPDPRGLNPGIPRDLAVIVGKTLQKDPNRRYQTAEELAEDLRRLLEHEPIRARPVGHLVRHGLWCRRNPGWAAAFYGIILMTLVTAGVFIWKNSELRLSNGSLEAKTREALANADRADANAARAESSAQAASAREREVQEKLAEVRRMADIKLVQELEQEVDRLWPLGAELLPRLETWQARARPLLDRLPRHREALRAIEGQALPYSAEDRQADHGPALQRIAAIRGEEDALEKELEDGPSPEREVAIERRLDELGAERVAAEQETSVRVTWRFPGEDDDYLSWQRRNFAELVEALGHFDAGESGHAARLEARAAASRLLVDSSLRRAAPQWQSLQARLEKSPIYPGLELPPQEGLIPLGPDPDSGLEEFLHWASHEPDHPVPERDTQGHLPAMDGETGVILVLLPGGRFRMGAQSEDPKAPNYDPSADTSESPVHLVRLSPFFMGKHELTRGQWTRLSGTPDPSYWNERTSDGVIRRGTYSRRPVEEVSLLDCEREFWRGGLAMPTEAQWEYACRAGTSGPRDFPGGLADFGRYANIGDETMFEGLATDDIPYTKGVRDGHIATAPVGSYEPNDFGIFDMYGNVWEWVGDQFGSFAAGEADGDRAVIQGSTALQVTRGCSYNDVAEKIRASLRYGIASSVRFNNLGVRAARGIRR